MDEPTPVLTGNEILELQQLVRKVPVTDHVIKYTLALVRQTRISEPGVPKLVKELAGVGGRAAGRAEPHHRGQDAGVAVWGDAAFGCEDMKALAKPVMRHRILANFTAASEGITTDKVIQRLLDETPDHVGDVDKSPAFKKILTQNS